MLQPAATQQTRTDVHCGSGSQRCVIKKIFSHPPQIKDSIATLFTLLTLSSDCSKTFRVSLGREPLPKAGHRLHPLFIPIGAVPFQHLTVHIVPNLTAGTEQSEEGSLGSVVVAAPHTGPRCVISVCRLLRPGVSAGLLPPLCQQQAAGDALSLPLPLRWAEETFLLLLSPPHKPGQSCDFHILFIFVPLSGFITCKFHFNIFH